MCVFDQDRRVESKYNVAFLILFYLYIRGV